MATPLPLYTVTVDDTLNGKTHNFGSDDFIDAERHALKMVKRLASANAVVKRTSDDKVLSYFES